MPEITEFVMAFCDFCGKKTMKEYEYIDMGHDEMACGDCWHSYLEWKSSRKPVR